MQTMYVQKNNTLQKASANTAESVVDSSSQSATLQRHASLANAAVQRAENPPRPNNTGLPDDLKNGVESLSGYSLDNVRVHYNSPKPATVQALAYTQGTDIHVAPGQEHALPHEAWHVTQQMAGRVTPTTNIGGMPVNDNAALEHEADVMGEKAVTQRMVDGSASSLKSVDLNGGSVQREHIYPTRKIITVERPNGCAAESELLPKIAFETLAGGSRAEDELSDLYQKELTRYTGIAEVFMGVNFEANIPISEAKDEADKLADKVKEKIDTYNGMLTQSQQTQTQQCGKRKSRTQQSGTQQKVPHKVTIYPFAWSKVGRDKSDYRFPFYEARSLLMEKALGCGAKLFRWIDSDVRKDASITKLNTPGYYGGINMPENENLQIYSGYYNWDVDRIYKDGSTLAENDLDMKNNLNKLNLKEKQLREIFWKIKEMCGYTNFRANEGYVPEPIVYMNELAHEAAMYNLKGGVENHMKQDRESDKAFVNMPVKFMPDFSVSKPVKVSSSGKSYMGNANFEDYTNIRQSAFDLKDWNLKNKKANSIYNGARNKLKNEHVNVINVMDQYLYDDGKQIDTKPKNISDFKKGDVGFSSKYGWVKVDEDLQEINGVNRYDVEVGECETNGVNGYDVEAKRLYVKTIGGHLISKGENIDDLVNSLSENIVVKRVYEEGKEKFCKVKKEVFLKPGSMETDFKFFVDENDKYYEVTKKAQSDEG